jgi:hypothetical protein
LGEYLVFRKSFEGNLAESAEESEEEIEDEDEGDD